MRTINKIFLTGNLGRDAEVKAIPSGEWFIARFGLASTESYKDKDGKWQEKTTWINCEFWAKSEKMFSRLVKGATVIVEGSLKKNEYEKDGVKKENWFVKVDTCKAFPKNGTAAAPASEEEPAGYDPNEDIPF